MQHAVTKIPSKSSLAKIPYVVGYDKEDGPAVSDGKLTFRFSTLSEMGVSNSNNPTSRNKNGQHLNPPMVLNANTGALTWDTRNVEKGQYSISVVVTDSSGSNTAVDWVVQVVDPPPKMCSYGCLQAGGNKCYSDADCAIDQCGFTVNHDKNKNNANNPTSSILLSGTSWKTKSWKRNIFYLKDLRLANGGKTCPTGYVKSCSYSGKRQRRGKSL